MLGPLMPQLQAGDDCSGLKMKNLAIKTERLFIRTMSPDDYETVSGLLKEGEIASRFRDDRAFLESLIQGVWLDINKAENYNALIFLLGTDILCGKICLQRLSDPYPELGIELLKAYQNQGIGPEAIVPFLNTCSKMLGIQRVLVRIWKENTHSIHVFEKLGAIADGVQPYFSQAMLEYMTKSFDEEPIEELKIPSVCAYHFDLPIALP